jgi:NAD(P)-dependent dehydrogenase (short-subunit alcohol dehydrogenase family)
MPEGRPAGRTLLGRTAIVTGGGAGIGGGVSRLLAAEGAHVVVNDIDAAASEAAAKEIAAAGGQCTTVVGDIRDAAVVDEVCAAGGPRIDVLVNNVGDYRPFGRFVKTTEDDWQAQFAVNFQHVLRCTHRVLPLMIEAGSGSIINVSTVEAIRGIPGHAVYSAYNAAILAFTRSLAVEVGGHGVRVNAIAPDVADTPQTTAESKLRGRDPAMIKSWVPLGRFGEPDDYAQVVLFLAGDQSRFVTGQTIAVDGGTLAAGGWYARADGRGWTNMPDQP